MRWGTLALGALGGAVSAAALFALWTLSNPAPALPTVALPLTPADLKGSTTREPSAPPPAEPQLPAAREPAPDPSAAAASPPAPMPGPPPLSALLRSERAALRELGPLWGQELTDGDPCASALRGQLQCYRTTRMTLHGLREMDRPAVLTLRLPGEGTGWAVLTAITSETATLRAGESSWLMPLTALADVWRGDYATLWRTPPGQTGPLGNGSRGPAAEWLGQQLKTLQARGQMPAANGDLKAGVQTFQRSQGIDSDGLAGPMTFMLVNRAVGVEEPRLRPDQP